MLLKIVGVLLVALAARAEVGDLSKVKFTGEIASKAPFTLKFKAPAGHHFNEEAPPKVEVINEGQATPAKLEKSKLVVTAEFPKDVKTAAATCVVKANLFVCDDKNTYCIPSRQEFDCQKLQAKN